MSISQRDIKLLWSKAAGYCSICQRKVSEDTSLASDSIIIGEQAHIVAEEPNGPRGISVLSASDRNTYFNLILLCPTDHTIIDKNPNDYPAEKLHMLKAKHELRIQTLLNRNARVEQKDFITLDDILEFHERIRPIVFWLHRTIPKEHAKEFFAAMQLFWATSNVGTDHIPSTLRHAIDRLLRPIAAETYALNDGRHYADSKIYIGVSGIMRYFDEKGIPGIMPDNGDKAEEMIMYLNAYCEVVQLKQDDLTEIESDMIKYVRQIAQYYHRHFSAHGPIEIQDSFVDQFLSVLSPFLVDRIGVILPEKTNDRALDRVQQFAGHKRLMF